MNTYFVHFDTTEFIQAKTPTEARTYILLYIYIYIIIDGYSSYGGISRTFTKGGLQVTHENCPSPSHSIISPRNIRPHRLDSIKLTLLQTHEQSEINNKTDTKLLSQKLMEVENNPKIFFWRKREKNLGETIFWNTHLRNFFPRIKISLSILCIANVALDLWNLSDKILFEQVN